ncbi:hypothetical protein C2G38_2043923 [Gigaspora rosea]|uniref:OTU domain-containing protein n=1 Tax=Gigaspora rosea TaxID=44941 RepID=A0A397UI76_9GLOM|nr:hypothetical protein C2G38_2043923 [Gigaspora rosea]
MHEHIKKVINVDRDGNCGYRALAIGLQRDKNEWPEVRKELQKELIEKEQFYQTLFLANEDYETIIKEISWVDGSCTFEHWIRMLQMGDVIANATKGYCTFFRYKLILSFFHITIH